MTAVFCHNAADCKADTWAEQLVALTGLEFAVSDAVKGIARAVADTAAARRDDPSARTYEHSLDVSLTTMEAYRALAQHGRLLDAAWERAEAAEAKVAAAKRQGLDARGTAQAARSAWTDAVACFERVERLELARGRAHTALDLFGPDGRLNDRTRAAAKIAAARADLTGLDWAKVRNSWVSSQVFLRIPIAPAIIYSYSSAPLVDGSAA